MQQKPPGPVSRLMDRLSLKTKLIGSLTVIGLCVAVLAYIGLGIVIASRIETRITSRTDELVTVFGSASTAGGLSEGVASSLVQFQDVNSVAFVEIGNAESFTTFADDGSNSANTESTVAGADLQAFLDSGSAGSASSGNSELRAIVVGNPFQPGSTQQYLIALELDEDVIASDLTAGGLRAIALMIAGIAIVILIAYLLIDRLVTAPLGRLARAGSLDTWSDPVSNGNRRSRDEIVQAHERFASLISQGNDIRAGAEDGGYYLPGTLPDVRLRLDSELNVIETFVDADADGNGGGSSLVVSHLSELLSTDVVEHVAETKEILEPGEQEAFEFSVGVKSYRGLLVAGDAGLTLEISESPAGVQAVSPPTVEVSQILAGLLEDLPVGVMDMDASGVLRYANYNVYGTKLEGDLVGKKLNDIVPSNVTGDAIQAVRDARHSLVRQTFIVPPDAARNRPGIRTHVVPVSENGELSLFVLALEETPASSSGADAGKVTALEEQLWGLELQVSEYESKIAELSKLQAVPDHAARSNDTDTSELAAEVESPMQQLMDALAAVAVSNELSGSSNGTDELQAAVLSVATVLDRQLGTGLVDHSQTRGTPKESRFHLATLLDEIAITASERDHGNGSRISAFVQPSLPKWLFGREHEARQAIFQMIEYAQLVSADRPLILAAIQDASAGRSVQVRFEVQVPPPMLDDEEMELLRGCISGDVPDDGVPSSIRQRLEANRTTSFDALDIELVKINDEAMAIRCSSSFEIAEDLETEQSWVRGLRTLIIQASDSKANGIQTALDAFGIIGYVVQDEEALVDALRLAEEYSNPYRFVLADVDTPGLESFAYQLFDGEAPVVLVGKKSESAMVGAISAGYDGYLAKPVRQVDLLEVILSTVEPPERTGSDSRRASAA